MQFWPFLVAASRRLDYRVVLCPDFIERSGRKGLFREIDMAPSAEGSIRFQEVNDDALGRISIYYRSTQVREGTTDVYDPSGRPLYRYDGIVIRGGDKGDRLDNASAGNVITRALPELDGAFASFWNATESYQTAVSRHQTVGQSEPPPVDLPKKASQKPTPDGQSLIQTHKTSTRRIFARYLLAISLIANAGFVWAYVGLNTRVKDLENTLGTIARGPSNTIAQQNNRIEMLEATLAQEREQIKHLLEVIDELKLKLDTAGK